MKPFFAQRHIIVPIRLVFAVTLVAQIIKAQSVWTNQASPTSQDLYEVKAVNQNVAWACGDGGTVLRCVDGSTWTEVDGGAFGKNVLYFVCPISANAALTSFSNVTDANAPRLLSDTTWIYRTTNGGSSWQIVFQQVGGYIKDIRMIDSSNGVAFGDPIPGDSTLTFLRTHDGGGHWSRIASEPLVSSNTSFSAELGYTESLAMTDMNHIWFTAGLSPSRYPVWIHRTTDGGKTWTRSTYSHKHVTPISFSDSLRGLSDWWGDGQGGCDRTTDGGRTWTTLLSRPHPICWFGANVSTPGGYFATTDYSDVYEVNAGDTLQFGLQTARKISLSSPYIYWIDMKKDGDFHFGWLVTQGGNIYKCQRYAQVKTLPPLLISPRSLSNAPRRTTFLWHSSRYATSYHLQVAYEDAFLALERDTVLADTTLKLSSSLWESSMYYWRVSAINTLGESPYSPMASFTTGVTDGVAGEGSEIPREFALLQNYPNPFNPITMINYQLPMNSYVTLKVYDVLGREITTLVNEKQNAGTFTVQWNATGFSSGIYFYRLEANEKREIRKMSLIK